MDSTEKDMAHNPPPSQEVPDPDEDDLDDLDDMLDEFSSAKISSPHQNQPLTADPGPTGPGRPDELKHNEASEGSKAPSDESNEQDDFTKQLQAGMADMMRELQENPDTARQLEEMMSKEFGPLPSLSGEVPIPESRPKSDTPTEQNGEKKQPSDSSTKPSGEDVNFQDTIRRTMDRMRQSSASATAASNEASSNDAANNPSEDAIMSALMAEMAKAGTGEGGDETFNAMIAGMMEQLTEKEVLYEPMKELDSKYPAWLGKQSQSVPQQDGADSEEKKDANKNKMRPEDLKRYTDQSKLVREIVQRFERPEYRDSNSEDREFIVERMQRMQASGAPPPDLVGDLGDAAQELMGMNSEGGAGTDDFDPQTCAQQ
ncbi:MAG: Peroxisome chaperone and import receptor [Alyxoria varia]|nr:MAG: Peroxisome chaperone and import receptor [Alyxoria varia]